ncbi:hypothetical protein [Mycobacterium asiaticum]|uniref:hypothetical protein n=1 Tax=Mycobacterium asiaticum TaxID=1790 RepID=UPI0012DB2F76|nr:hypothetical protein [Mycobacterium asiaticum]
MVVSFGLFQVFLRGQTISPGGLTMLLRCPPMSFGIADAGGSGAIMSLGGLLVYCGCLLVQTTRGAMSIGGACMRRLGMLRGTLHVVGGHGHTALEF